MERRAVGEEEESQLVESQGLVEEGEYDADNEEYSGMYSEPAYFRR